MRERTARIRRIAPLAERVLALDAEAVDPPSLGFLPGQFLSVRAGPRARRSFSISSEPGRVDGFDLVLKPTGSGTTARFVGGLSPGDVLRFYGPMGYFLLDDEHPGDLVFAATGVGISAIYPMVKEAVSRPERGRVLLYWGLRSAKDVFWREELERAAAASDRFDYQICLSGAGQGRITPRVVSTAEELDRAVYYLCGNGDMIEEVKAGLVSRGVDRRWQIRTEIFYPPARS